MSTAPQLVKSFNKKIATNNKVELIHVSLDRSPQAALAWAKQEKFPWVHVLPDKYADSGLLKYYKNSVPHYVLIDKGGKILAEGSPAIFDMLDEL
ncbi:MAG: thioredoxin-like domain-containing protein [Akkermansiaceae bacterium]|nr:thioredoxin-like domain-containing protein [Akkermansiaceae bacterium]